MVLDGHSVEDEAKLFGWPLNQDWDVNVTRIKRLLRGPITAIIYGPLDNLKQNPFYDNLVHQCQLSEPQPWWKGCVQKRNTWQPSG